MDTQLIPQEHASWDIDFHAHLGFSEDPLALAQDYYRHHIACLSATVTPSEYDRLEETLGNQDNVRVALGAHPWWIHENKITDEELKCLCEAIPSTPYIGEIGLDFSKRFEDAEGQDRQTFWFDMICNTISQCIANSDTSYVLSIHSVRATQTLLDILEKYDLPQRTTCIIHWFSGTHAELVRASKMGCYFSINPNMLSAKRAKSYLQTMPAERILLESDLPEEEMDFDAIRERELLHTTKLKVAELKGSQDALLDPHTQAKLLNLTNLL